MSCLQRGGDVKTMWLDISTTLRPIHVRSLTTLAVEEMTTTSRQWRDAEMHAKVRRQKFVFLY